MCNVFKTAVFYVSPAKHGLHIGIMSASALSHIFDSIMSPSALTHIFVPIDNF